MGRALRFDPTDGWHHVMNRGVAHGQIFFTSGDGNRFLGLLGDSAGLEGVEVHAFCLMTNHFHLLVHCPEAGLPGLMHRLGSRYARYLNDRLGRDGPVFRGRYRSFAVMDDGYLRNAARYIHRNPIDIRPVVRLDEYRWSSYRNYCDVAAAPSWLHRTDLLRAEGGLANHRLGVEEHQAVRDGGAIAWAVETAIAEAELVGQAAKPSRRAVSLLLAESLGSTAADYVKESLEFPSVSAYRSALSRARAKVAADQDFAALVQRARRLVMSFGAWHQTTRAGPRSSDSAA